MRETPVQVPPQEILSRKTEGTHRWGISPLPWEADVGEVGPILMLKTGDQAAEIQKTQVAVTEPQAKVRAVDCEHGLTGPVVVVEQPQ